MFSKIGRYEIKRELGRGGMAGVYEAHDPRFERAVAVKVLPRELMVDTMFRTRFEREAKVIASLEHPGIVPVYDYGEENGQPYLVMQYMAGGSLAERLALGRLPLPETADLVGRIAPAVDYANGRGISHRDLKPANIVFDRGGEPRVADFGIARISESRTALTQGVIGTPAYMSPEQWEGIALDGRSDVYSLGVMAFEMLTGQTPYVAETMTGFMKAHLMNDIPDARDRVPQLPVAAQYALARALAKDRNQRYDSASEFARDLVAAAQGKPLQPATVVVAARASAARSADSVARILNQTQVLPPPSVAERSAVVPAFLPGHPAAVSDSIVPPAAPKLRIPPKLLIGILASVIVLSALVALVAVLSNSGSATPAFAPTVTGANRTTPAGTPFVPAGVASTAPTPATIAATVSSAILATLVRTATPIPAATATTRPQSPNVFPARTAVPTRSAVLVGSPRPILNCAGVRPAHAIVIPRFSCWRYFDASADPGAQWKEYGFDDSSWKSGQADLGYGDRQTTTLSFGTDAAKKRTTTYFRQPFTVTNIGGLSALFVRVWRDDSVVVYLNGVEVLRDNLPGGVITSGTYALANIALLSETQSVDSEIDASGLVTGLNVLAAEVHQDRPDSSDSNFGFEMTLVPAGLAFTRTACAGGNPIGVANAVLSGLGCLDGSLTTLNYLQQEFERGRMIVFDHGSDPKSPVGGNVYVLIDGGRAYRDGDSFRQSSDNPDTWYTCQATPGQRPEQSGVPWRGFGVVWCKSAELRAALGRVKPGSIMREVGPASFQGYQGGLAMRLADIVATFSSQDQRFPGLISGFWR
ncbi:MAG: protein kinase [Thermoflexales bacterium]